MPLSAHFQDEIQERTQKSIRIAILICVFFLILLIRLFYLQVLQAELNIRLSKENQMRIKTVKAPRGIIYDRNGLVIARNRPSYSLCLLPYQMNKRGNLVSSLLLIRDLNGQPIFDSIDLVNRIKQAKYRPFDMTRLKEDVSMDIVSVVEEHSMELPGIIIQTEARREYPLGPMAFHVIGYMTEIPESQFDSLREDGYLYGDKIGTNGIEKQYEKILKGKDGVEYIEVNAYGRSLGPVADMPRIEPVGGNNIYLSLDAGLQKVTHDALADTLKGGAVAINPQTGEVLALYSSPSIDPNIFSLAATLRTKEWVATVNDPALPLNNRVISGTYPPGSTFKVISALAGLESGRIDPESYMPVSCNGSFHFGNRIAHCWKEKGHGRLKLKDAIKYSCNIYFYQVGLKVGDQIINSCATRLGLGQISDIDLPNEQNGWLSGEADYNKRFQKRGWKWTKGLVLDLAIGQTQIITPIQLALMIGGLGNSRFVYEPSILKEERTSDGIVIRQQKPVMKHALNFKKEVLDIIHKALEDVVEGGGTGGRAQVEGVPIGGKTGSAENPQGEKTHGLFIAYAPLDSPVIAISVVVENAGHGGTVAAPIAGQMFRYYFKETPKGREIAAKYTMKNSYKRVDDGNGRVQ